MTCAEPATSAAVELVETKSWQGNKDPLFLHAKSIRFEVFVEEQQVPADVELDWIDEHCTHFLITANKEPIGTMRIFDAEMFHYPNFEAYQNRAIFQSPTDECKVLKVGRFAVRKQYRSHGYGRKLMDAAERWLLNHYAGEFRRVKLVLHSQTDKRGFYAKSGFVVPDVNADGTFKEFLEENIWHVKMEKVMNI